jgi:hypothetical protein
LTSNSFEWTDYIMKYIAKNQAMRWI